MKLLFYYILFMFLNSLYNGVLYKVIDILIVLYLDGGFVYVEILVVLI